MYFVKYFVNKNNSVADEDVDSQCYLHRGPGWGIDEYEYMEAHMFLFDWTLLDAEGLGHSVGLLKLQLLLLGIWQDSLRRSVFGRQAEAFFSQFACKGIPKELLWPPDNEDTEFLITLGMEVLAWSLRVAIFTCPPPSL